MLSLVHSSLLLLYLNIKGVGIQTHALEKLRYDLKKNITCDSRLSATTLKALMSEINNLREETERAHKELEEQRQKFKQVF